MTKKTAAQSPVALDGDYGGEQVTVTNSEDLIVEKGSTFSVPVRLPAQGDVRVDGYGVGLRLPRKETSR